MRRSQLQRVTQPRPSSSSRKSLVRGRHSAAQRETAYESSSSRPSCMPPLPRPADAEPSQIHYFHRASAYLKKHQYSHALSDLNRAMSLDPKFYKGLMSAQKIEVVVAWCI